MPATKFDGEKSAKNATYVDAVARTNVLLGVGEIRQRSPILAHLEQKESIKIVGAMYDLATGRWSFSTPSQSMSVDRVNCHYALPLRQMPVVYLTNLLDTTKPTHRAS